MISSKLPPLSSKIEIHAIWLAKSIDWATTKEPDGASAARTPKASLASGCGRSNDCVLQSTIYVGDASRDIEAGTNAGMATIAAGYGYITPDDDPAGWGADRIAEDTVELADMLRKALNLQTT